MLWLCYCTSSVFPKDLQPWSLWITLFIIILAFFYLSPRPGIYENNQIFEFVYKQHVLWNSKSTVRQNQRCTSLQNMSLHIVKYNFLLRFYLFRALKNMLRLWHFGFEVQYLIWGHLWPGGTRIWEHMDPTNNILLVIDIFLAEFLSMFLWTRSFSTLRKWVYVVRVISAQPRPISGPRTNIKGDTMRFWHLAHTKDKKLGCCGLCCVTFNL